MKNYYFTLTRVYETLIQVKAETPEQATEKFKQLGEQVYQIELEHTCIIDENLTIREEWEGEQIKIENPLP